MGRVSRSLVRKAWQLYQSCVKIFKEKMNKDKKVKSQFEEINSQFKLCNIMTPILANMDDGANVMLTARRMFLMVVLFVIFFPCSIQATDVGGIIDTDTTWDLAGSPYIITATVQIAEGVTLTIQPGVVIEEKPWRKFGIEVWGTMSAIGTESSNIVFNSIFIKPRHSNSLVNIQFSQFNWGSPFNDYYGTLMLFDSKINDAANINLIYPSGNCYIKRNIFDTGTIDVGSTLNGKVYVRNNIFFRHSDPAIEGYNHADIIIEFNSFLSTDRIALRVKDGANMIAINNFWNTIDTDIIDSMIYDKKDDLNRPIVIEYVPFLTEPHPDTPTFEPPVADAGPDQTVDEGDTVTLDGSNSSDPDDGIASYLWTQTVGTSVTLSDPTSAMPTFTAPSVGVEGEALIFQLTVTDKSGLSDTDTVIINVSSVNQAPTSNAGPDQTVDEGDTITLDGSNSFDPDDGIASYQWTQAAGPVVSLSNTTALHPTFIAPFVDSDGTILIFQLTVVDKGGLQNTDEVSITIKDTGITNGYLVTSTLWIRAVINTEEKGPIDAVWKKGGEDTTSRGDTVIWGHFYASPNDVTWGSQDNPDLFAKIWFDVSGRVDVNFFHVSVPDIEVYSDYLYDGTPDEQGTTTMDSRYIRQYYENGESYSEENYEDGNPPSGYSPTGDPFGYSTIKDLRIGSIINTVEKGPIDAVWRLGGLDTTARGDQVVWGHFYASPSDVTWGSENNPDLFVKIWFDVSGRMDVNFFHVSVPDIEVYSDLPDDGTYDQKGTTIMDNRYIRHEYWR